ncbi:NADH kinase-like isoform X1 [Sesamum indicum]|uniref:NADH kinase n=1 Tax=Sesamum indicum TaxID=4182 RepID=A0A6I9TII0_SESIN|nr:NADH kinase-like isoform X1 [Sesamum indicum]XP_020549934.1 NADH kinase-like isoform X1 [Sesamum indicum]
MVRKRLLMLLKPFDVYPSHEPSLSISSSSSSTNRHKVLRYLYDRTLAHKNAINFCQNILKKKVVDWKTVFRFDLSEPIRDVDLVVTVGGDGTLLQASHLMDDSIPVLGVNSDPTRPEEVAELSEEFDATRSTGYLCAATANNFEQMIDGILENRSEPSELARMAVSVNSKLISTAALNDVLLAHPCPATVSRFSFRIKKIGEPLSSLLHCRSSGLRVSTAAGSTAAMLSAGGSAMPILSKELQYMVREPISPGATSHLMHGTVKSYETMDIGWFCREGLLYIDGSHVVHSVQLGDTIELSSGAPPLKVYLSPHLLSHYE